MLAVMVCAGMGVAAMAAPAIEFESTTTSVGDVCPSTSVKGIFTFKNVGDEDLEIIKVDKSCDCTVVKPDIPKLKPGESSKIEFQYSAPAQGGNISKSIAVNTNDPDHKVVRLELNAQVIPIATADPQRLNFGTLKTGASIEKVVVVTPAVADGFKIGSVTCAGKCVSVSEFKALDDAKGSYSVEIVIKAGDTPGRVLELVRVKTNVKDAEVPILVFGNVVK